MNLCFLCKFIDQCLFFDQIEDKFYFSQRKIDFDFVQKMQQASITQLEMGKY